MRIRHFLAKEHLVTRDPCHKSSTCCCPRCFEADFASGSFHLHWGCQPIGIYGLEWRPTAFLPQASRLSKKSFQLRPGRENWASERQIGGVRGQPEGEAGGGRKEQRQKAASQEGVGGSSKVNIGQMPQSLFRDPVYLSRPSASKIQDILCPKPRRGLYRGPSSLLRNSTLFTSASLMAVDHRGSQGQEGQDRPLAVGFLRAWAARLPGSVLKMELETGQRDLLLLAGGGVAAKPSPNCRRRDCSESVHTGTGRSQQTLRMSGKWLGNTRARERCFLCIFLSIVVILVISKAEYVEVRKGLL